MYVVVRVVNLINLLIIDFNTLVKRLKNLTPKLKTSKICGLKDFSNLC